MKSIAQFASKAIRNTSAITGGAVNKSGYFPKHPGPNDGPNSGNDHPQHPGYKKD
jgi:hypothetical protein